MKILGISCFYHDSAAALLIDGKIIAASEEERFSRIKHDSAFPTKAIDFCLNFANINYEDLDYVIFYEKPFSKFERITLSHLAIAPNGRESFVASYKSWLRDKLWIKSTIEKNTRISPDKILFSDHHLSHAAATFYTSPFDEAAILTCDGVGEWTTTAWGIGRGSQIELREDIGFPHSLGLFYSAFTEFLGFQVNEGEFKVMGLAPYGKPIYKKSIEKLINQSSDGSFSLDMSYFNYHKSIKTSFNKKFEKLLGIPPLDPTKSDHVFDTYANIAASAQSVLEDKLLVIAKYVYKKTKMQNLCYSGGVALNGVSNWKILENSGFKNIFIHPAAGDSGGALGACLFLYYNILGNKRLNSVNTYYLGKENSEDEIKQFIKSKKLKYKYLEDKKLVKKLSKMISQEKVVGWVRGRVEWGPRALGARSILADPRSKEMKEIVNSKIKFREAFRPFAPVCLIEQGNKVFDVGKNKDQEPLKYMIAVVPVNKSWRRKLGAVTHLDGTARPQFISRSENPLYYDLINEFYKITDVPVLLNTSFNLKGEPIVNTCEDAYNTFQKSGLDALVLGNYLIVK